MPPLVWLCVPAFVRRSQEPLRPPGFRSYEVNPDTPAGAAALLEAKGSVRATP